MAHICYVENAQGQRRNVKNLGWMLRNWKRLESVHVHPGKDTFWHALLKVKLRGGGEYVTDFADLTVLVGWLNRPVLQGLPITFHDVKGVKFLGRIGDDEYTRIFLSRTDSDLALSLDNG